MKKVLFVFVAVVFSCSYAYGILEKETPRSVTSTHYTFSSSDIIPQNIKLIKTLANEAKEQGYISIRDNVRLKSAVEILIQNKVLGLTAAERQKLVKETIGEDTYSILEQVFMKMLSSSNIVYQRSALTSFGFPLFDLKAVDEIKKFVFHNNRDIQWLAVQSLVYLDEPGADYLLLNIALSGILPDYQEARVIDALYITNNKDLEKIAPVLLTRDIGGGSFKSLLPVLKKRDDYNKIAAVVFKSSMFNVPDKEELTLEELAKANATHAILRDIFENTAVFMADEDVKKKVIIYANGQHRNLSTLSLLILEKSGQELEYFTEMLKDSKLTENKKRTLEHIISRIQKGERLK